MPDIPDTAKQPADRKRPRRVDVPDAFTFTGADGEEHTLEPTLDELTPGFIRLNRQNEEEIIYGLFERLATPDQLQQLDRLSFADNSKVLSNFQKHIRDVMGAETGN